MLPVSKFFRIHWYAPLPYKMERPWTYIASEKKIGEFLSTLFCLHSLFGLSTADSLFVFDHGKTWTEDDVLVCRGTLTRIPHTSAPTHLKTQMHFDDGSTNFWFDTNCSLSSDGKYTSWYPHSRTQYGLEFPRERLRISTFSQIDHSVVDCITAIRFQVQNLPPCEYTFKSDLRRPLHTINIQYNGMWSVECIGDEQKDCK